tara:strand:- start:91 stop:282 length:192 start_codon:yes stop_codon:yes gene_type:complete
MVRVRMVLEHFPTTVHPSVHLVVEEVAMVVEVAVIEGEIVVVEEVVAEVGGVPTERRKTLTST